MSEEKDTRPAEQEKERVGEPPPLRSRLGARTGVGDKTLWDVLQLLIVPLALTAIGFWFTWQQDVRQQDLEDQRARSARNVEQQRAQDAALQAYLDQMSTLLIEEKLDSPAVDSTVPQVARARTLAALPMLDGRRKSSLLLFLLESQLIFEENYIVPLVGADLSELKVKSRANLGYNFSKAYLHGTDLSEADLHGVMLREAALTNTDLSGADLTNADLTGAELHDANLTRADLTGAELTGAELPGADLSDATVTEEQLATCKSLEDATMPDGSKHP
jgi:hypothetical protein